MIQRCLMSSHPPRWFEQLELRPGAFFTRDAMKFRPGSIAPIDARGVQPHIVAAIEGNQHLDPDPGALLVGRVAPRDHLSSGGFP